MRVAFDLDGVIVDILSSATPAIAAQAGIPAAEVDMTWIYHAPFTHRDPAVAARLVPSNAFWQRHEVVRLARPLPGAIAALNALHAREELAGYITRRAPETREATLAWLAEQGAPRLPLHTVGNMEAGLCYEACKSDACAALGATHFVDDNPHEAGRVSAAGYGVVIVDHPLGRAVRDEWRAANGDIPVARDAAHAVEILTGVRLAA